MRKTTKENQTVSFRFERIEKKFWLTKDQYQALLPFLEKRMDRDAYGETTVCNIYYDTPDYSLIRRSIERPLFKEKLRVRSYGLPKADDPVFVEIKRKLNGIGYKRRIRLPFHQAKELLRGQSVGSSDSQVEGELLEFVRRYRPEAKVYLTYRRFALTGRDDPGFRVTFDRELAYRTSEPESPSETGMAPMMDDPTCVLMEIKACGAIPSLLTSEMSRLKIYQAPFSKIGTCYSKHIAPRNNSKTNQ